PRLNDVSQRVCDDNPLPRVVLIPQRLDNVSHSNSSPRLCPNAPTSLTIRLSVIFAASSPSPSLTARISASLSRLILSKNLITLGSPLCSELLDRKSTRLN